MAAEQLKTRAKKGFIWNTIERIATNGIQFLLTIILARLLSPNDYGIIAMPAIFLALAQVLIDSGFANALIRKPDLNEKDLSTAFYFNIVVGLVAYLLLFLASPLIADFFNTPILSVLLKVTALVVVINSLGIVQQAVMTKKMDFKTQTIITIISTLVSGIGGIWMAYNGNGIWALAFQQVSAALIRVVLLWTLGHWHPILVWSRTSFNYLWSFGSKIIVIGFLDTIFNNIYAFVIGKMYNAKDLGNYSRAQHFVDLPINNINGIISRVTLPLLSEIQGNNNRLNQIYTRLISIVSLLVFPLLFGMAAIASPLIYVLLGKEWSGCIIMFQILCVARIWTPINAINLNLLQVKGRTDLFLKLEIVKKIIHSVILVLTFFSGVYVMLIGYALVVFLAFLINTYYTKKIIGIGLGEQFMSIFPFLFISVVSFVVVYLILPLLDNCYTQLIIGISIYCFLSFFFMYLFKRESLNDLKSFLCKK